MSPAVVPLDAPPSTVFCLLSFEKIQQITAWRMDVDRYRSPWNGFAMESLIDLTDENLYSNCPTYNIGLDQFFDDGFDMDRWTYVPEGDRRIHDLPHPEANPLMCADVDLIEEEYVRVLHDWNEFEKEKWGATKKFQTMPTPANLQHLIQTEMAVDAAGTAARYIELHANRYRLPTNFDALFFRHYRPPNFYLYLSDSDSWTPPGIAEFNCPSPVEHTPNFNYSIPQPHHQPYVPIPPPDLPMFDVPQWSSYPHPLHLQLIQV